MKEDLLRLPWLGPQLLAAAEDLASGRLESRAQAFLPSAKDAGSRLLPSAPVQAQQKPRLVDLAVAVSSSYAVMPLSLTSDATNESNPLVIILGNDGNTSRDV